MFTASISAAPKNKKKATPFTTQSYIVADEYGGIIKESGGSDIRSIASISKLMVAVLVADQDMDELLQIPKVRKFQTRIPSRTRSLSRQELLTLSLVKSDNFAAQILCNNIDNCVERMNGKALELGMWSTHFSDPTGLHDENVSTASDLVLLAIEASRHRLLKDISRMPKALIETAGKPIEVWNTNPLTQTLDVVLSKTGTTSKAGGCILAIIDTALGRRVFILLGSKNGRTRIQDLRKLIATEK
jgi:D-alanyl-D-alanine endopeptidase (penicillin-binding protein 7)